MAGHNKWKQIKHKKAATDAKRASVWTKVIREITVAAKVGGGDPGLNPRLRKAIEDAKAVNMPNDNIDRAVKKGTGELEGATYEEVTYEGYGPGGTALLIEGSTDNPTRTVADIRHAFSRNGGNLGTTNSVGWMFERKGQIVLAAGARGEDQVMEDALECGASDFEVDGDLYVVSTDPQQYHAVMDALTARGYAIESSELAMIAQNLVKLEAAEAQKVLKLIDVLEELDDVSKVFTNLDFDALELEEAGA
ncbi:MAG: YebC/PmpR family DNA-binding transcriptional regulator [Gemmatimonadetes bacterium]|nr:YebC/PmpR family DNA-binding transcriptional regulator [Gemmatimonadota bacterium]MCB9504763.1 YebC/PmpR family DNA-binding transcriptional regulator [Gemmatimonadales bacterium]MCA9761882.1 YebC/PmpR family DNA-binding transcriptional regulator [Gemmatimonadota bacterium]MCA9767762.1 YebC/PmpR family DNA-binding transcriptional regulator [Gemmatimonadota bacterium]HPF63048.1 YebC/PmpR family DNA-binding transcriptional regulator [Gemmatimonadales bacterium]